jgi:hypothetical protein
MLCCSIASFRTNVLGLKCLTLIFAHFPSWCDLMFKLIVEAVWLFGLRLDHIAATYFIKHVHIAVRISIGIVL